MSNRINALLTAATFTASAPDQDGTVFWKRATGWVCVVTSDGSWEFAADGEDEPREGGEPNDLEWFQYCLAQTNEAPELED
jgi:hypothetical protein